MIKTLRITSVAAVVLAVAFFAFPAVFGVRGDEQTERFLDSASVIEKFKKLRSGKSARGRSQVSPLVVQAQKFAGYLDPPKPRLRPSRITGTPVTPETPVVIATPRPPGPVSSKFTLIGISYYASHPELSLVLIDEPGKGLHWVRQFGKVGHLIIEQVKDGLVVVRDRQRTFELAPKRAETKSLLKGKGAPSGKTGPRATSTVPATAASFLPAPPRLPAGTTASSASSRPPQMSAEKSAAMEKLMSELKAVRSGTGSDKAGSKRSDEEAMALMGKLLSDFQATRISAEEAKRLERLGKELKDTTDDPNRPRSRKIERQKSSQEEPNSPAKK